jgi:predicted nucleotidyltransferase
MLEVKLKEIIKNNPSIMDLENDLKMLINEIVEKIKPKAIILAGSLAKGKFVRGMSDIDILIIIENVNYRTLLKAIKNVDVEITMYTYDEIINSIREGNQFIKDAINNGIPLIGEEIVNEIIKYSKFKYSSI